MKVRIEDVRIGLSSEMVRIAARIGWLDVAIARIDQQHSVLTGLDGHGSPGGASR